MGAYGSGTYGSGTYGGASGGGRTFPVVQATETDLAQPIARRRGIGGPVGRATETELARAIAVVKFTPTPAPTPVIGVPAWPDVVLECAFGVDPGAYAAAYDTVARSLVPAQYLRMQDTSGSFQDRSRRGNVGVPSGSLSYAQASTPLSDPAARSVLFSGGTIDASVPQIADPPDAALTVIGWLRRTNDNVYLFNMNNQWGLWFNGGFMGINTFSGDLYGIALGAAGGISPVVWAMFAVTVYPNNVIDSVFMMNGTTQAAAQRQGTPNFGAIAFSPTIHWLPSFGAAAYAGHAAELMVVPYAVDPAKIADLYQARLEGAVPVTDPDLMTWTNLSKRLRQGSTTRGRTDELQRFETGQSTLEVDNTDRALEPEYSGSVYFPNVIPNRMMRLKTVFGGITRKLFTGFVYAWPQEWPSYRRGVSNLTVLDGTEQLLRSTVSAAFPQQNSGARVHEILDAAGWALDQRDVAPGQSTCAEKSYASSPANAIDLLNAVAESEGGYFYFARDGKATFHDRSTRSAPPYSVSAAAFGDGGEAIGELPYRTIDPEYSVDRVQNVVEVQMDQTVDGVPYTARAVDWPSRKKYRERPRQITSLSTNNAEADSRASVELARYKDPQFRFTGLGVEPRRLPLFLFPAALGLDISSQVTVLRRPQGGTAKAYTSFIEHEQHRFAVVDGKTWETSWALSPTGVAVPAVSYWVLGTSTLDNTTVLGF